MYSSTSAMRTSDTVEPRWGRISTSPSAWRRASASETGNRDTPRRSQMALLSMTSPGRKSSVTMAWRKASVT
jgi:hypothetical protein